MVFVDYLTKWPEVFPVPDQSSATVTKLLVEEVVSRHGVPSEILSDRGQSFLSGLMKEVELLLGFHKINTTAYHPQTDGLVERYNRTLTSMLAKTVEAGGPEWDERLPYVLFAYRASQQTSTRESTFYLVYGRDPRLPTPAVLNPKKTRTTQNLKEYGLDLHQKMTDAWDLARQSIGRAQRRQKDMHDKNARTPTFREGERVFLFKPAEKTGEARKFARPFHGPYRVGPNTAKIRRVDRPQEELSLDRLRRCPQEIGEGFWPPNRSKKNKFSVRSAIATGAVTDTRRVKQGDTVVSSKQSQGTACSNALPLGAADESGEQSMFTDEQDSQLVTQLSRPSGALSSKSRKKVVEVGRNSPCVEVPVESSRATRPHHLEQSSKTEQCDEFPTVIGKQPAVSQDMRSSGLQDPPFGLEPPEVRMDDSTRVIAGTQTNVVPGTESRGEADVVLDNGCIGFEAAKNKETRPRHGKEPNKWKGQLRNHTRTRSPRTDDPQQGEV